MFTKKRPLRVGTDCSGIEAPIVALQQLKIPFSHEFSSEIDKHCIATIRANFSPKIIFGDITQRKLKDIPDIDLYVCGFPCQPFSMAGKREGVRDARGTIFWECLRVIRYKKPMVFILENVRGLLSIDGGETFRTIIAELEKIRVYNVRWKVLNTADYGIPQSRKRVFIVGILKKNEKHKFEWPQPIPCRPLTEFVDWGDRTNDAHQLFPCEKKMLSRISNTSLFVDLSFRFHHYPNSHYMCPTVIAREKLWCVPLLRYANIKEYLKLQGFLMSIKATSLKKKHIGNAISVNVLEHLFKSIFQTMQAI
jgi:DNA (cytosine-5)-methyltransferase 1